jgi:ubiquinol-cytochrome c reductase subunit 6
MLEKGQDPKDLTIEYCQPECKFWKDKLGRCEAAMKSMTGSDPEKNCMYPLRDYVTCIEACV